jgi:hypothetical protein
LQKINPAALLGEASEMNVACWHWADVSFLANVCFAPGAGFRATLQDDAQMAA